MMVNDLDNWKILNETLYNIPKNDPVRLELMMSPNNTNDAGAFINYTNIYQTFKTAFLNHQLPKFATPYGYEIQFFAHLYLREITMRW